MRLATLIFLLLSTGGCLAAEMYKWVDKEGNIQYTQTPPPAGIQSTLMKGLPNYSISGGSKPPAPSSEAEILPSAECLKFQRYLREMRANKVVVMPDAEHPGKFLPMPENVRQERMQEYQTILEKHCKNLPAEELTEVKPDNQKISSCQKLRDYLTKLNSEEEWIIPDPDNPEQFMKLNEDMRQQKIAEATAYYRKQRCK